MKRFTLWLLLFVFAAWFIQDPNSAAHLAQVLGNVLSHALSSISAFAGRL